MKICFPVEKLLGEQSPVYGHFGSAPYFFVIDDKSGETMEIRNMDSDHAHGKCSPLKALDGQSVDTVVVGGIGAGALGKLVASGISVYRAEGDTVADNMALFREGRLHRFNPSLVCGGKGHAGGCSHH